MTSPAKRTSQSVSPIEHWTDDLPVCSLSGVGFCQNQRYRLDGGRREEHEFEDQSFHFSFVENNCCLYGVFDGHSGRKAAEFAAQKLPAELLFGQLTDGIMNDDEVKCVLKQAFIEVEKGFFTSIGDELVEKTLIQEDLAGVSQYEASQKFPEKIERLRTIEQEIGSGTTAVVALIYNNKLFVTNVGNSRALLCTIDNDGRLHVEQLSTDHVIANKDELIRLSNLGLDMNILDRIGNHESTRSIGDYTVKGGYKESECDILRCAHEEPVIAEPDSCDGIIIDDSFYFLILMSDGLYKSLEDSKQLTQDVNIDIVGLVAGELQAQSTINGVCQAVVDRICRFHHDAFMNQNKQCERRDDMTLLLRLFTAAKLGTPVSPLTNFHPFTGQPNIGYVHIPIPGGGMPQTTYPPSSQPVTTFTTRDNLAEDQTEYVESCIDFTEYYEAIESYGEDYVTNSVQL